MRKLIASTLATAALTGGVFAGTALASGHPDRTLRDRVSVDRHASRARTTRDHLRDHQLRERQSVDTSDR